MKRVILIALLIAAAMGCGCSKNDTFTEKEPTPVIIGKGQLYGNGREGIAQQELIVTSQKELDELIKKMSTNNDVSKYFSETKVNFEQYSVVAIFWKVLGSGPSDIEITKVIETEHQIKISGKILHRIGAVMNQPFCVLKLPKTTKKIEYTFND